MTFKMRLWIVLLIIGALALEIYAGVIDKEEMKLNAAGEEVVVAKETITLWYTDDALTDFLSSVALNYYEDTDVHVSLKLVSGLEYLETINRASIAGEDYPDLFIVGNDSLGKAFLSGLASEIKDGETILNDNIFGPSALNAVTYDGRYVAYPMYYETSYLLYNKTYLYQIAHEREQGDGEAAEADAQAVAAWDAEGYVPRSVKEILEFADRYETPDNVDAILKWDVSDIFYNYFFAGNYLNIGGPAGDNPEIVYIYNENAIRCLNIYQDLNQFFSIDADSTTYAGVMQEFMEGRMIYTIATTDAIAMLERAKADGTFAYEYGVALIPDLTETLKAKEVSVTTSVAINGYSDKKAAANRFAIYCCSSYADALYARTGKVSARRSVPYDNKAFEVIERAYELSIPMPKVVESSNFWVELEMAYTNIWLGDDANSTLKRLSEQIKQQITGEKYTEAYIEVIEEDVMIDDSVTEE